MPAWGEPDPLAQGNPMRCWILIADASRAKILTTCSWRGPFRLLRELVNPRGRAKAHDLMSDESGRYCKGGKYGIRSAMEPRTTMHAIEMQRFANELAELLPNAETRKEYDYLASFAPAEFLGHLRQALDTGPRKHLLASIARDLTEIDARQLAVHMEEVFSPEIRQAALQ